MESQNQQTAKAVRQIVNRAPQGGQAKLL